MRKYTDIRNRQTSQLKTVIEQFASKIEDDTVSILWCGWISERRFVGIMQTSNPELPDVPSPFQYLNNCKKQIAEHSSQTVTVGFSQSVSIPEELRQAYREAESALAYKAAVGSNTVIQYDDSTQSEADVYRHLKLVQELVVSYRMTTSVWLEQYSQLFNQLRSTMLRKEELISLMNFFCLPFRKGKADVP